MPNELSLHAMQDCAMPIDLPADYDAFKAQTHADQARQS
jgi:hypothetical protein